jgi:heat shock protein HslJ
MEVDGSALDLEGLSTASIPEAPAWISFDSEGELKGEGNCNDFSASYEMCGGILRVGLVWMPVNMCQENREVESAVIGMLFEQELDVAFSDGGETLELAAERTRAVFTRR